jgi:N-acetylglutamate synthase-like GNAT family acetyltransferase
MHQSPVVVRLATPADAQSIAQLYAQLVTNPAVSVLPERISEVAKDPNTALLICEYGGHACGTALVSLCADVMFKSQPFAVVENVVIAKSARGQGVGTVLFEHIENFCRAAECSKIMLLSAVGRADAHRFFERMGFVGSAKRGFVKYRSKFRVGLDLGR